MSNPVGMASDGGDLYASPACPVSAAYLSLNPVASRAPLTELTFHTAAPEPAQGSLRKQPPCPPPTVAAAFPPQGSPLVLPAFPSTSLVSGGSCKPSGAGPSHVIVEMGTGGRPAVPLHTPKVIVTQAPLIWNVPPGDGGSMGPAPLLLPGPASSAPGSVPMTGCRQAAQDRLTWGPPLGSTPPVSQEAPIRPPVSQQAPWPQRPCTEGSRPTSQAKPPPPSVYQNFRRWQQLKALVWKKLPQTPDGEALACFFIPVLRSLARLKPTMSLDEGLWRGLQEWEGTSNYERMNFHEMAAKFMEFEATEVIENSNLQGTMHFQGPPPAIPLKPDSPRPSSPDILQQPEGNSSKTGLKAQPAQPSAPKGQRPPETKAPEEIPPEAVEEYMAIMDWLEGLPELCTQDSGGTPKEAGMEQQDVEDMCSDPELLSLLDQLCCQEDFMSNVEAIIHPTFLEELLSSKPDLDLEALIAELEQEEGLTPEQIVEKRLGALRVASSVSELAICQGAERNEQSPQQAVSADTSTLHIVCSDDQSHGGTDAEHLTPAAAAAAVLQGGYGCPSVGTTRSTACPRGHGSHPQRLGSGDAVNHMEERPAGTPRKRAGDRKVGKEGVPSLASLLGSEYCLLPWGLSQSPRSPTTLLSSGHQAPGPSLCKRRGHSLDPPPPAKSKKRARIGDSRNAAKNPCAGSHYEESAKQDLALGLVQPSQPQKRKREVLDAQRKKRKKKNP
ncbi:NUT family member 2G-like [Dipodomys merriami]|uniref:NUT family member 2G-like n=1 Tax=Dipodomys merriami TaxID=94247 RepID=UPI003855DFD9